MLNLLFTAAAAASLASVPTRPAPSAPQIVVPASWLSSHLHDPHLVVLALTEPGLKLAGAYDKGHIPNARALDFNSIFMGGSNGLLNMELVSADSLRSLLEGLGVSDKSEIVLYGPSQWVSPVARAYVTLDYLGLGARAHVLDGGYDAWVAGGGAVDQVLPAITRGVLHVTPRDDAVTNGGYVRSHLTDKNMTIVDARAPEFYAGSRMGHYAARTGHVPGAYNVYFKTVADSVTNLYATPEQARAKFVAAGVPLDKPVVVYCHIGQTASVDYVQLRRLGVPVRLYDGSFEDWSRRADYPVVSGDKP